MSLLRNDVATKLSAWVSGRKDSRDHASIVVYRAFELCNVNLCMYDSLIDIY